MTSVSFCILVQERRGSPSRVDSIRSPLYSYGKHDAHLNTSRLQKRVLSLKQQFFNKVETPTGPSLVTA